MTGRRGCALAAISLAVGCAGGGSAEKSPDPQTEAADTDADLPVSCANLVSVAPSNGALDVYYRGDITLVFDADASAFTIAVLDPEGDAVATSVAWSEDSSIATVSAELSASTTYTVVVDGCGERWTSMFATSTVGAPLAIPIADLVGRTYVFSLAEARMTEPAVLEPLVDALFTAPLLFMVVAADAESITWEGAPGTAALEQVPGQATWPFPAADFTSAPHFGIEASAISFEIGGHSLPVESFFLEGDFASDAGAVLAGRASGFADTREVSLLFGEGETAACDLVAENGVNCEPCTDGAVLCLPIAFDSIVAYWREGLTVEHVEVGA